MTAHVLSGRQSQFCSCFIICLLTLLIQKESITLVSGTTMTSFSRQMSVIPVRAAIARDSRYGAWPNATAILYRMDTTYTAAEQAVIQAAMNQITADMSGCIRFQVYVPGTNAGSDNIYIGKTLNNGQAVPTCFSFPGRVIAQAGQGQKMAIFGPNSANGCLDTPRNVMKYLVHALGLRNEYNRPDRDTYIQIFSANIQPALQALNILKLYTAAQVDYLNTVFDYNSVTIPAATKYAIPGTVLYTPIQSGQSFGSLGRLSQGDCIGLALQYNGCNFASCQNPYGPPNPTATTTVIGGVPVPTPPATTAITAPTTTNTALPTIPGVPITTNRASTITNFSPPITITIPSVTVSSGAPVEPLFPAGF